MKRPSDPWNEAARRGARSRAESLAGVILVAAALSGAAACRRAPPLPEVTAEEVRDTRALFEGIPQRGNALGDPKAPVTLVEFTDLQCPFCRDFAVQTLPVLIERYVRSGKLRIELRDLAFLGEDSVEAARMAAAVGLQGRGWQFVHLFFLNQGDENTGYVTDATLRHFAATLEGLDVDRAMKERSSMAVTTELVEARREAQRFGIQGTPSFLLGRTGEAPRALEVSPLRIDQYTQAIDALLEQPSTGAGPPPATPSAG